MGSRLILLSAPTIYSQQDGQNSDVRRSLPVAPPPLSPADVPRDRGHGPPGGGHRHHPHSQPDRSPYCRRFGHQSCHTEGGTAGRSKQEERKEGGGAFSS